MEEIDLTEAEVEALRNLKRFPDGMTCSMLGSVMWDDGSVLGCRDPQSYARPAGKLLQRVWKANLVYNYHDGYRRLWYLTTTGSALVWRLEGER